jgi:hypothetical protein
LRKPSYFNVPAALHAICSTGKGRCWYCDWKLPPEKEAVNKGWHVQCMHGERVDSIIVVCPKCLRERAELGEEQFLCYLPPVLSNAPSDSYL